MTDLYDQFEHEHDIQPIIKSDLKSIDLGNYVIMREGRGRMNNKSVVQKGHKEKKRLLRRK